MKVLTTEQAAEYLSLSPRTLDTWRSVGRGPKYIKISARCIRYRLADLDEWVEAKIYTSTSEYGD